MDELGDPLFLGLCSRATSRWKGLLKDLYGVSHGFFSCFYPCRLTGTSLLFACSHRFLSQTSGFGILLTDINRPSSYGWFKIGQIATSPAGGRIRVDPREVKVVRKDADFFLSWVPARADVEQGRAPAALLVIPAPDVLIMAPTKVKVELAIGDARTLLGHFDCRVVTPRPIDEAELLALKSKIGVPRSVTFSIKCKDCGERISFVCPLDPKDKKATGEGEILLSDAGDEWACRCEKTRFPLQYLKDGLPALFRSMPLVGKDNVQTVPLYERAAILDIWGRYQDLINSSPTEEKVQSFMEVTPAIWGFLGAARIIPKPPLLSRHKGDFAILTTTGILNLVEIEKPSTRVAKKKGGLSAELQKGLDQISEWKAVIKDHRLAVLSELKIRADDVMGIQYLIVAGLTAKTPRSELSKVRSSMPADTAFYTFDDLGSLLYNTSRMLTWL